MNGVNLYVHKDTASITDVITSVSIVYTLSYMFIIMLSKMNSKMHFSQSLSIYILIFLSREYFYETYHYSTYLY